jgi:O-antigen/teichoic acid export membrane protein
MGVGGLLTALSVLFIGLYAMHRLKLPLGPIFLAQFRRDTARRQLYFGVKLTIGQEPFRLTSFLESLILIRWLRDSPTWLGLRDLLQNRLTMLAFFSWGYYQSAVPVVSEALAAGKRKLVQYYVARYLQFGSLFAATIFSLLCAVGPLYIERALGTQWGRAADYLILASVSGLLLPWAWLTDALQQGAGRPGTTTLVMLIEQGARLVLLLFLIQRFQFLSIYVATLTALLLKIAVAWTINHRRIVPLRVPLWQTLGAPHLAAFLNYFVWRGVAALCAPVSTLGVLVLFLIAGAGSIALCFFLLGLFGGLDSAARRELDQAGRMVALIGPLCRALAYTGELGARLAPYLPKPPVGWQEAQLESAELERVG